MAGVCSDQQENLLTLDLDYGENVVYWRFELVDLVAENELGGFGWHWKKIQIVEY